MAALNTDSDTRPPVIIIDRFSYAYPGAMNYTLRDVSLRIEPGECHLLEGPIGSGKTTLLMAIRGLLPPGHQSGTIDLTSSTASAFSGAPGLIQQNPKAQLLCAHLGADIAFGLENHCIDPAGMAFQVEQALKIVGLNRPLHFPVDQLSMGQQYRACIAGQLVMDPLLVMMDEPVAQLDPRGRAKALEIIRQLKRSGRAVLICEHRPESLQSVVDRSWRLESDGRLTEPARPPLPHADNCMAECVVTSSRSADSAEKHTLPVIRVKGLTFASRHGELDISTLDFSAGKGECIAVSGPNGSGKTTLIRAIAGLVKPLAGTVEVFGTTSSLNHLRDRLTVLFQDPGKQLFETTVFDEVAFSARRNMGAKEHVAERVNSLLHELGLSHLAEASPHTLSYGQKHLVGLAAVLAGQPQVLLLDDPFAGLDSDRTARVMQLVAKVSAEYGTTVLWTTHDPASLAGWTDKVIEISANQLAGTAKTAQAVPSEVDCSTLPSSRKLRMSTGVMLSLCMVLAMSAFAARSSELLIGLSSINLLLLIFFSQEPFKMLKKSGLLFFWQAALIVLLYIIRFGFAEGAVPGGRVAWQLFLAFWPGMIFMSANSQPRIVRTLSKVLPQRTAFVSATCLRFLPMLLAEMQQIREAQILRGAKILVTDLKYPRYWPDWFRCLLIPTLIKTLSLADDIATAASARDFGIHPKRTAWPGD
jgi:energy-coupling factor transporter ATP-binding protein EcfA2